MGWMSTNHFDKLPYREPLREPRCVRVLELDGLLGIRHRHRFHALELLFGFGERWRKPWLGLGCIESRCIHGWRHVDEVYIDIATTKGSPANTFLLT